MNRARQLFEDHGPEAVALIAINAALTVLQEERQSTPTNPPASVEPSKATPTAPAPSASTAAGS
ncbi:MAG: hypothetical protein IT300_02130 [Dehalococcoidia bacterium]|nr:hypothetical protein [Dehalococcoidia bacterium]